MARYQPTAYDSVLVRLINWATNYIQNECGRSFVQKTYGARVTGPHHLFPPV